MNRRQPEGPGRSASVPGRSAGIHTVPPGRAARADARPRFLIPLLIALAVVRIWLGTTPGYPPDLQTYKLWAVTAGVRGIHTVYDDRAGTGDRDWAPGNYDYPPLYAYILAPIGAVAGRVAPMTTGEVMNSGTLGFLVKIPPLLFDAAIAGLMGLIAYRFGLWRGRKSWLGWAAALLYLLQPAVLFDSGYWGQPDVIHTFFVMLSLTLILLGRFEWGWVAFALGCLMKPLAAPFFPLLALATYMRGGWRKLGTGAVAAAATALVFFLPFIVTGRGVTAVRRFLFDVDLMAYTSINAHNLWWILGPWRDSRAPWIGPVSKTMAGLILFGAVYLWILWKLWKSADARLAVDKPGVPSLAGTDRWYMAAAGVAFSFFFLSTHMHENHLFTAIPFLLLLAYRGRGWAALAVLVGLASFVNMANHDLILGSWVFRGGAPSSLALPDPNWHMPQTAFTIGTVNAVFTALLYGVCIWRWSRETGS